jgi:hypothetical protein
MLKLLTVAHPDGGALTLLREAIRTASCPALHPGKVIA